MYLILLMITLSLNKCQAVHNSSLDAVYSDKVIENWFLQLNRNFQNIENDSTHKLTCSLQKKSQCCWCDQHCYLRKDCCIDRLFMDNPQPPDTYLHTLLRKAGEVREKCASIFHSLPYGHKSQSVMMIMECPETTTAPIQMILDCEAYNQQKENFDYQYIIPVLGSNNKVYRNKFCALCNGIYQVQTVNIIYSNCEMELVEHLRQEFMGLREKDGQSEPLLENVLKKSRNCFLQIDVKSTFARHIRICGTPDRAMIFKPKKAACNETEYEMCLSYTAITRANVNGKMIVLPNPHCAKCIRATNVSFDQCYDDFQDINKNGIVKGMFITLYDTIITPFSVTISFSQETKVKLLYNSVDEDELTCGKDEVYDWIHERCTRSTCGPGYSLSEEICVKSLPNILKNCPIGSTPKQYLISDGYVIVQLTSACKEENKSSKETKNLFLLSQKLNIGIEYLTCQNDSIYIKMTKTDAETIKQAFSDYNFTYSKLFSCLQSPTVNSIHGFKPETAYSKGHYCALPQKKDFNETCTCTFDSNCWDKDNDTIWIEKTFEGNWEIYVWTCRLFHLQSDCLKIEINSMNYTLYENKSIAVKGKIADMIFEPQEYLPTKDGIAICKDTFLSKGHKSPKHITDWQVVLQRTEEITSIVLISISIITNLVTIYIHVSTFELQSIPGKTLVMLCCAVLGCDMTILIGMVGKHNKLWCKFFAAALHYFSLSMQFWTLLISMDMAKTIFSGLKRRRRNKRHFCITNVSVWLITSIIVLSCVILDALHEDMIMYGHNAVCWIGTQKARIYTYLLPSFIVFSVNLLLLVMLMVNLRANLTTMENFSFARHRVKQMITLSKLMVKVVIIFGLLEVVGVIQVGNSNEVRRAVSTVVRFIYTVIRSMRGTLLFIVLVILNTRAKNVLTLGLSTKTSSLKSDTANEATNAEQQQ